MRQIITRRNVAICIILVVLIAMTYSIFIKPDNTINIHDSEIPIGSQKSILAKVAGMFPNDKSKAEDNGNLLIKALNKYNSIVIDDLYYIATPTEPLTTKTIEIVGIDNSELIAADNSNTILFDPSDLNSITLRNLKFTNNNKNNELLIVYSNNKTNSKVENVNVEGCTFSGTISVYRQYGNTMLDPDIVNYGIGEFLFKNNKVYNTELSFITLFDIPIEYCEISNNYIQNFMHTFLKIEISNDMPFENKLYKHINYLKVDNNFAICEDNWWEDTSSGNYYTFVLFEGKEVLYNNNHVEGMKAISDIALYDAYLNAQIVDYTNNTWKNNICFDPKKTNNTLLKSKQGGSKSLVRNYTGNTFVVEEDFADRVGQSKDNMFVYFISLTEHADTYTISNNTFDIYDLRFPVTSISIGNLILKNNIIRAKRASGNLAVVTLEDINSTYSLEISKNKIEIDEKSDNLFNLIKVIDNRKGNTSIVGNIIIDNNQIKAPFGYLLYEAVASNLMFTNNTITDIGDQYSGFAYKGYYNESTINNNTIESMNSIDFYEGRQFYGNGLKNEILNIVKKSHTNENDSMFLDAKYNSKSLTKYKRTYQINTQNGIYEFYYTFVLSYNEKMGFAEVTFEDKSGSLKTYKLGSNLIGDGNGEMIKVYNDKGDKCPYSIEFINAFGKSGFYIANKIKTQYEIKIETVSSISNTNLS